MNRVIPNSGADIGVRPCGNRAPEPVLPAPGPWVLNVPGFGSGYCVVTAADGRPVAAAMTGGHERPFTADQVRLHGRMVQSAPEAIELLGRLIAELDAFEGPNGVMQALVSRMDPTIAAAQALFRYVREGA